MKSTRIGASAFLAGMALAVALAPQAAMANVYPAQVTIDTSGLANTCGLALITYVLNEDASGNNDGPGVTIKIYPDGNPGSPVRVVDIPTQAKGPHVYEWDGRDSSGQRVSSGSYAVEVTARSLGHSVWTKISTDNTATSFYVPAGVTLNKNQGTDNYGKIYVSNAVAGTTAAVSRSTSDGIYRLNADATEDGFYTGGVTWTGGSSPWRGCVGPDNRLYMSDLSNDLTYEFSDDMSVATLIQNASNRTANQWVGGVYVTGTQAAGNRVLYSVNVNYNDTARRGVIQYNLGAAAAASGTGTQFIGANQWNTYYPYDAMADSLGDWYGVIWRSSPGQAPPLKKWQGGTPPLTNVLWSVPNTYTGSYCADIHEGKGWIAYGDYYTGDVKIFRMSDGAYVDGFDSGSRVRDISFDAAGNLYTVDNLIEWLRVWSPPDGPNSKATARTFTVTQSGSGGPSISTQPQDTAICGGTANFSVVASGSGLTYQWKKNGVALVDGANVSGATTPNLTLSNLTSADNNSTVSVTVCGTDGVVISRLAVLNTGLTILQHPATQSVCKDTNVVFTVVANGLGTLTYQWEKDTGGDNNFQPIDGANSSSWTWVNVQPGDTNTKVRCLVGSDCPAVYTNTATLTVKSGPIIAAVAFDNTWPIGTSSVNLICNASGTGTLHYQWQKDGSPIPGAADSNVHTLTNLQCPSAGSYTVLVTDDCGSTQSAGAAGTAVINVGAPEVCNNGFDDDCDGNIDCVDSDCSTSTDCVTPCNEPFADADDDGDVDMDDFGAFQLCFTGPSGEGFNEDNCHCFDRDSNNTVDAGVDLAGFMACGSGADVPADLSCDDYPTGDVVINEVQYDEWTTADVADNREFVELYNKGASPVDISGWVLRTTTMAGKNVTIPGAPGSGSTMLPAGGFYVIGGYVENVNLIVSPSTDYWENDREALELVDANGTVKDTVVYERFGGEVPGLTAAEGGIWGPFVSTSLALQSWSRWVDGADTGSNGRDFGLRPVTPGASNNGTVITAYAPPDVNALSPGNDVPGLQGSFVNAKVVNPADTTLMLGTDDVNPNVIPASPQGGNVIVAWDPSGGGNVAVSSDIMTGDASYDLWVYLDTSNITIAGAETTAYGLMGTVDPLFNTPDPGGTLFAATTNNPSGCTGVAWIFQKDNAGQVKRLFLVDAGPGGNSTPDVSPMDWVVHQTIDMSAVASGWYRLSISYTGATGAVVAKFGAQTFNFNTAAGLKGGFYVGYRESLAATPASLRPPTFDNVQ